jgi:hypothetical protein
MGVLFWVFCRKSAAGIESYLQNLIRVFKALMSLLFEAVLTVIAFPSELWRDYHATSSSFRPRLIG